MPVDRPILMSTTLIRPTNEGRKTKTRRIVKWHPNEPGLNLGFSGLSVQKTKNARTAWSLTSPDGCGSHCQRTLWELCPYGEPGDRLWVRENWRVCGFSENFPVTFEYADGMVLPENPHSKHALNYEDWYERIVTSCTKELAVLHAAGKGGVLRDGDMFTWKPGQNPMKWHPSIHMPRWASRISLEVTDVRVERLQEITEEDAVKEGINVGMRAVAPDSNGLCTQCGEAKVYHVGSARGCRGGHGSVYDPATYRGGFAFLWDQINGKRADWKSNPWVWVISFRKLEATDAR